MQFRKAKWMWESVTGSEADAIRAEYGVGRSMAAAIHDQGRCDKDSEIHEFLDQIGHKLAKSVSQRAAPLSGDGRLRDPSNGVCAPRWFHLCDAIARGTMWEESERIGLRDRPRDGPRDPAPCDQ